VLDAAASTNAAPAGVGAAGSAVDRQPVDDDGYSRPWWESDPSIFGDRARRNGWGDADKPGE
jgi:hypothetical protein